MAEDYRKLMDQMIEAILTGDLSEADSWVASKDNRSREDQLAVYANAYIWRLVDVIREDYECLEDLLEDDPEPLPVLVERYVRTNPSRLKTLARYGNDLPEFLSQDKNFLDQTLVPAPFAIDLAQLESAMTQVFYLPESPPLAGEDLQGLEPAQFGEMKLSLRKAARLLECQYPVNDYYTEFNHDKNPAIPSPQASYYLIYRDETSIWRMTLGRCEFLLLRELDRGHTVMDSIATLVEEYGIEPEELMAPLEEWFARWVHEKILLGSEG